MARGDPLYPFALSSRVLLYSPAAPLLPAFQEIGLVGIDKTCSRLARTGIRNISPIKPLPNGSWCHAHVSRNLQAFHPLQLECYHLLVTSRSLRLTSVLRAFRSRVSWDDFDAQVRIAARRGSWLLPAQHDAVASGFGSVALRHRRPDSCGMGSRRGTSLLLPFFDPLPPNPSCSFYCNRLSSVMFCVRLTKAFVSSASHRSHLDGR